MSFTSLLKGHFPNEAHCPPFLSPHTYMLGQSAQSTYQPLKEILPFLLVSWYTLCPFPLEHTAHGWKGLFVVHWVLLDAKRGCHVSVTQQISVQGMISVKHFPILDTVSLWMWPQATCCLVAVTAQHPFALTSVLPVFYSQRLISLPPHTPISLHTTHKPLYLFGKEDPSLPAPIFNLLWFY